MDIGQRYTDQKVEDIEKRLKSIYKEAGEDIKKKLSEFNEAHKARDAKYRAAVEAGEMSKEDYQAWLQGQVYQGKAWQNKKAQMAKSLYHANENAMSIVNGSRFDVFAENANWAEYRIARGVKIDPGFGIYNQQAVARLAIEQPKLLPPSKVSYPKDMAWNMKKLGRALTQGIIQGEGIDKIAERMADVTGSSRKAMVLHARTSMTGAQNAGRIYGMEAAQELGINVKKQWMATLDNRTRDSHQELDGQVQDVDKPFDSILGPIMYPGDYSADPANVYNCRCTLIHVIDDRAFRGTRRDNITGEDVEDMTYEEWKKWKEGDTHSSAMAQIRVDLAGIDEERRKHITKTLSSLTKDYPLNNAPLKSVQSFRTAYGLDENADLIDFTDEHTEWEGVGAIFYPISTKAPGADRIEGPHITLFEIEEAGTESINSLLSQLADIREKNGWHSPKDSFFNTGIGTEGQFIHEYGHALANDCGMYWGGKHYDELEAIYKKYSKDDIGKMISIYASTNPQEMFAEAFVANMEPRLQNELTDEIMGLFKRLRGGK